MKSIVILVQIFFLAFVIVAAVQNEGRAQYPSLNSEDMFEYPVVVDGKKAYSITVMRGAKTSNQWYYVPIGPRLVEKIVDGKIQPEFTLLTYGVSDPANPQSVSYGGSLQFSATYQLEQGVFEQLQRHLADSLGIATPKLSALTPDSASVALYYPSGGDNLTFLSGIPQGTGIAPLFATQSMSFSVPLNEVGTNVVDAITNSNSGLGMAITFKFWGRIAAGFKVHVNYKKVFEHYSKDEHLRASASYFGLFGASYEYSSKEVFQKLSSDKSIEIEVNPGETMSASEISEKYLAPILQRINQEILTQAAPPQVIPASAVAPSAAGKFFSAGYSVALRRDLQLSETTEDIEFRINDLVRRQTVISGGIGISRYPEEIKKQCVVNISGTKFKEAAFALPPAVMTQQEANQLGIKSISLQIGVLDEERRLKSSQYFTWKPQEIGWKDHQNRSRQSVTFPLGYGQLADAKNQIFRVTKNIVTKEMVIKEQTEYPYEPTSTGIPDLYDPMFYVLSFSVGDLIYSKIDSQSDLAKISIVVKYGDNGRIERILEPKRKEDERYSEPDPIFVILDRRFNDKTSFLVERINNHGVKRNWKWNNKMLSDFDSYRFDLYEKDFEPSN